MKDALGDRIKGQYEDRTRYLLPRRTYTIIRVDGKAFHTLTKGFERPYDRDLMDLMDHTAIRLCEEIQGAKFAYVQSDEISILVTDFESEQTCAWFDGNVQKMASISAAIATAEFNEELYDLAFAQADTYKGAEAKWFRNEYGQPKKAYFDSRVFTIPDPMEVENYFIWRQNDASRNSVQMAARTQYSHKTLEGKGIPDLHNLLHDKGINWNDYTSGEKRGRIIMKETYEMPIPKFALANPPNATHCTRTRWISKDGTGCSDKNEIPIFTQDRAFLRNLIPQMPKSNFGSEE